jgi:hypothetical protein
MTDHEINRALSGEPEIVPSSGFAESVMDAVRSEAAAPPPIPFPWRRALPGLIAWAMAIAIAVMQLPHAVPEPVAVPRTVLALCAAAVALLISLAAAKLSAAGI